MNKCIILYATLLHYIASTTVIVCKKTTMPSWFLRPYCLFASYVKWQMCIKAVWSKMTLKKAIQILTVHCVEISWFFDHSDFAWYQFWGFEKYKTCHLNTFRGSKFKSLWIFAIFGGWNIPNQQNSGPQRWLKSSFRTSRFSKNEFM